MPKNPGLKDRLTELLGFTPRQYRGVLVLLPLLALICVVFIKFRQPNISEDFLRYSDEVIKNSTGAESGFTARGRVPAAGQKEEAVVAPAASAALFEFDPNTIDLDGLKRLGFSQKQAQSIINYRNAGARFRKAEDFARSYVVSQEKFEQLRPYIKIGSAPDADNPALPVPQRDSSTRASAVLSPQAQAQSQSQMQQPSPQPLKTARQIEINTADSIELVSVRGIGPATAQRLIHYRRMLGGFHSAGQLKELAGRREENYLLILQQISVDTSKIVKIDINFAPSRQIAEHPYVSPSVTDKILKTRQLKGGWISIEEMVKDNVLTGAQAEKLSPYLYFKPF